ncbi:Thioesterase family protein [Penicillium ucsense]|uniref:Thioesterase family protein n=1 Tax=Penicillium ucsense TaxID=2839758 RepID=A0A8J8W5F9_9EURO|nr:Thioesterase family protein [Penicillium ucsense]KAF7733629.1 Thioesterase family protein [Penicillium ucsense]
MASSDLQAKKSRKRSDYGYRQVHQTRWFDNDMYAHLNNTVYTALFDTIANAYLIEHCGRNPFSVNNPSTKNPSPNSNSPGKPSSQKQEPEASMLDAGDDQIGLIVSTHCDFFASVAFPDRLEVGLRVARLGSSSVTWEIGVFREGEEDVKMVGTYTHVFVLRETMRVGKGGMVRQVRDGLEKLLNEPGAKL